MMIFLDDFLKYQIIEFIRNKATVYFNNTDSTKNDTHSFRLFLERLFKSTTTQRHFQHSTDSVLEFNAKAKCHRQLGVKD